MESDPSPLASHQDYVSIHMGVIIVVSCTPQIMGLVVTGKLHSNPFS